ncbi:hypothetical protein BG004_003255, partial [Podila humilis]
MLHIFKALCLVASAATYAHDNLPPKGANAVSDKTDKIKIENWHSFSIKIRFPILITIMYTVGTMVYLLEMVRGGFIGHNFSVDKNLNVIKAWQVVALVVALLSHLLRVWAVSTLNYFFTYRITIRPQHKLVNTGPYTFIRHPSYTGLFINQVASYLLLYHEGLWDIISAYITVGTEWLIGLQLPVISNIALWSPFAEGSSTYFYRGFLHVPGGIWLTIVWCTFFGAFIHLRVLAEEAVLEEHFGEEWKKHAATRG